MRRLGKPIDDYIRNHYALTSEARELFNDYVKCVTNKVYELASSYGVLTPWMLESRDIRGCSHVFGNYAYGLSKLTYEMSRVLMRIADLPLWEANDLVPTATRALVVSHFAELASNYVTVKRLLYYNWPVFVFVPPSADEVEVVEAAKTCLSIEITVINAEYKMSSCLQNRIPKVLGEEGLHELAEILRCAWAEYLGVEREAVCENKELGNTYVAVETIIVARDKDRVAKVLDTAAREGLVLVDDDGNIYLPKRVVKILVEKYGALVTGKRR